MSALAPLEHALDSVRTREKGPRRSSSRSPVAVSGWESMSTRTSRHPGSPCSLARRRSVSNMPLVVPPTTSPTRALPTSRPAMLIDSAAADSAMTLVRDHAARTSADPAGRSHAVHLGCAPHALRRRVEEGHGANRAVAAHEALPRALHVGSQGGHETQAGDPQASAHAPAHLRDVIRDRAYALEDGPGLFPLGDPHAELLLDRHGELQGVQGVEPEPGAEERHVVLNRLGIAPLEIELRHEQELDLGAQLSSIHLYRAV